MKIVYFLIFGFFFCNFCGCLPAEEASMTLSFWTDKDLAGEEYKMVYVNETYIGDFNEQLETPVCNDPKLVNFKINRSEDLLLSIRTMDGESINIGIINLYSVSSGIKIKPSDQGEIFVDRSLDDICTLVYLSWD